MTTPSRVCSTFRVGAARDHPGLGPGLGTPETRGPQAYWLYEPRSTERIGPPAATGLVQPVETATGHSAPSPRSIALRVLPLRAPGNDLGDPREVFGPTGGRAS